jgi:Tol biopolymer transport system component
MSNLYDKASLLGALLLLAVLIRPAAAQPLPLGAPLLAFDTAAQDRVWLYDVEHDQWRALSPAFGASGDPAPYGAWTRVWGFTADGCRLLLTLSDGGALPDLYTVRLDGRDLRAPLRTADLPAGTWGAWEPQASPDGAHIAMTLIREQIANDGTIAREHRIAWIDAVSAAGSRAATPTLISVSGDEHTPRWSPDGARLVYVSYEERIAGADIYATAAPNPDGTFPPDAPTLREADLWMVDAADPNGTKFRLTDFPIGSVSMPRWSPDGDLLAFVFSPAPNQDLFWMIGAARGASPTQLTRATALALDLTWTPDGSALVAAARDLAGVDENRAWRLPLTAGADTQIAPYFGESSTSETLSGSVGAIPAAAAPRFADYPRFSADGRYLALRSAYGIVLYDHATGAIRALTPPDGDTWGNTPPVWTPAAFAGEESCRS